MRLITQKDGDQSSYFNKKDEREAGVANSTLKHLLIDSHTKDDTKGKVKTNLPLEHLFGFCKTFKKDNKGLRICTSNKNIR